MPKVIAMQLGLFIFPTDYTLDPARVGQLAEERPYGVDSGFRDPSGNSIRLTEVRIPLEA